MTTTISAHRVTAIQIDEPSTILNCASYVRHIKVVMDDASELELTLFSPNASSLEIFPALEPSRG